MQETRYNGEIHQRIFSGDSEEDLRRQMDAALRPGEQVIRRRELSRPEVQGINRHERRKAAALARRSK